MTLHHANRGGILTEEVEQLLNEIARGNTREVFKTPAALQALMDFRLVIQRVVGDFESADFQVTPVGWKYVTCARALALHKLQDPAPAPMTTVETAVDRSGKPVGGQFARHLFGGMLDTTVNDTMRKHEDDV